MKNVFTCVCVCGLTLARCCDMPLSSEDVYAVEEGINRLSLVSQGEDAAADKSEVAMVS